MRVAAVTMRIGTYLNQVLAFRLGDERLELGGGEGIDQSRFGDHEQEDLGAREDGEFVCLNALPQVSPRPRHRIRAQRTIPAQSFMRQPRLQVNRNAATGGGAHLLHDACLALGEGDVPTRFVLDEFNVDLPSFTTRLVVVIIVIVGGGADARSFDATVLPTLCAVAVTGRNRVVVNRRRLGRVGEIGHI